MRDGRLTPFVMRVSELREIVPLKEYRLRQTELGVLTAEVVGADVLADSHALRRSPRSCVSTPGRISKFACSKCRRSTWGLGTKRLAFRNELLT